MVQERFVSGNWNMLVHDWYPQGGDDRGETPAGVRARLAVELINRARRFWHSSLSALFFLKNKQVKTKHIHSLIKHIIVPIRQLSVVFSLLI